MARPKAIASDRDGRLYVTDAQRDAILVFSRVGEHLATIEGASAGPRPLVLPAGIAITDRLVFVSIGTAQRIEVFELVAPGAAPAGACLRSPP
jgi:hypothetical protein